MPSKVITIPDILEEYKGWIKNIQFLKDNLNDQNDVKKLIKKLQKVFEKAKDDWIIANDGKSTKDIDYGEYLNWYEAHNYGKDLWKKLMSASINNIDTDSKGNSKLFEFLKKSTEFEELLYGLEDYYRDHTLHSLWVYFLGEYILRTHLKDIHDNLNWYIFNDIEREKLKIKKKHTKKNPLEKLGLSKDKAEGIFNTAKKNEEEYNKDINDNRDAIWCIIALCHDLGYSLSKLNELNINVGDLLEFFDLTNIKQVGYNLDVEDQYIVSQFLELMSMDVRMFFTSKQGKNPQIVTKCYRDDSVYWQLSRAMEGKQHGILSSYLIYKILSTFSESTIRGPAEEWGLDDTEVTNNVISGDILYAIAQHTFNYKHLSQLSSLADILILVDDIEEFSRYGRKMKSRDYHDTTANVMIKFETGHPKKRGSKTNIIHGDDINIEIKYQFAPHLDQLHDFYKFFSRKAKDICKTYSLGSDDEHNYKLDPPNKWPMKFSFIKSIKMEVQNKNKDMVYIIINEKDRNKIYLPKIKFKNKLNPKKELKYLEGEYDIACIDDEILIIDGKLKYTLTLEEWLEHYGVEL